MRRPGSLVFYIGNGVVKCGLIAHNKGKNPDVLALRVSEISHYEERNRDHLEKKVLSEFENLVNNFKTKDIPKLIASSPSSNVSIKNAYIMMASPWYVSETTIVKMKEAKPFTVTEAMLLKSKDDIVKAYRDAHKVDVTVLEQKILRVALNGYLTTDPIRKKAQSLDMTIFTSFARHSSVEQIKNIIEKYFGLDHVDIHSQSLVSFSVIGDTWKNTERYIIADITSELTELVSVRNGILSEASSFPMGKQYLLSKIGESLGVTSEVAASFIKMKKDGTLDMKILSKIDQAIQSVEKDWLKAFTDSLSVMSSSNSLPNTFFLFAPKDIASIFSSFISNEEYQQFSFADGKFEVHEVSTADLAPYCTNGLGINPDVSIMILGLFSNKMHFI